MITGNGDVVEPEDNLMAVGSGGAFAQAAARALMDNTELDAPTIAEKALEIGARIIVAATVETTIAPTRNLILNVAEAQQKEVELIPFLCEGAWEYFEQGDLEAYHQTIAHALSDVASKGDVIVLAQASMAEAVNRIPTLPIPVLSSPRLGVEAAIKAYRKTIS